MRHGGIDEPGDIFRMPHTGSDSDNLLSDGVVAAADRLIRSASRAATASRALDLVPGSARHI
ncbi:hypothetical protein C7I55_11865 [Sphingomonas deserti]|uniref:Uncharacterized protein n=1 Tax=Allosphingosinicella deserti TaxID=2116704 RepID=A0A2P7QSP2_9SPHN|nr:hypothetical protein C7I55_11865 [Sphingomonas deserti]